MSIPFTPVPPTATYYVSINGEEWEEFKTPVNASKKVADNIFGGGDADVRFEHVVDIDKVRSNFEERIGGWLRQVGYTGDFHREPKMGGSHYRLHE